MKKASVVLLLLLSLTLAACSKKSEEQTEWNLTELTDQLKSKISYTDQLETMDPDLMGYLFPAIDTADVKEQIIYVSTGSTAEEIAAFEAVDDEAAKRIEDGLKARVAAQTESFTDYVPEEVKRLEDALIVRNGSYVILSVSGDTDTAKEVLGQ